MGNRKTDRKQYYLKKGLISQSLSLAFFLLVIRHWHYEYIKLLCDFGKDFWGNPLNSILKVFSHSMFGELLIFVISFVWLISSALTTLAFKGIQASGFESHGEMIKIEDEDKEGAASFVMTFVLPLLIDELDMPQKWISYVLMLGIVYVILYKSNLYYQSPILALLGYSVFSFKICDPGKDSKMRKDKRYIGITKGGMITEDKAIMRKHISDNVYLVYNEGENRQ